MAVADLANVPMTPGQLRLWSFAHMAHHRDTNRIIMQSKGIVLPEYALDPVKFSSNSTWTELHQQMHNNNDSVLGVGGFDLTQVNWQDVKQRSAWIWLNFQLHYAEAQATGLW